MKKQLKGFNDAKPRNSAYWRVYFKFLNKKEKLKEHNPMLFEYLKFVLDNIDHSYFITLTPARVASSESLVKATDFLIHIINQKIHTREYKEKDKYIEGYAFIEGSDYVHTHMHILIKKDFNYDFEQFEGIVRAAANIVLDDRKRRFFNQIGLDFQDTDNYAKVASYCMKDLRDRNIDDRLKFIGKEGLC